MISFSLGYFIEWMYHINIKWLTQCNIFTFNKEKKSVETNRSNFKSSPFQTDNSISIKCDWNSVFFLSNGLKWMKSGKLMNNKWSITVESKEELQLNGRGTIWLKSTHFLRLIYSLARLQSFVFRVFFKFHFFILWLGNYRFSNEINNSAIRPIII